MKRIHYLLVPFFVVVLLGVLFRPPTVKAESSLAPARQLSVISTTFQTGGGSVNHDEFTAYTNPANLGENRWVFDDQGNYTGVYCVSVDFVLNLDLPATLYSANGINLVISYNSNGGLTRVLTRTVDIYSPDSDFLHVQQTDYNPVASQVYPLLSEYSPISGVMSGTVTAEYAMVEDDVYGNPEGLISLSMFQGLGGGGTWDVSFSHLQWQRCDSEPPPPPSSYGYGTSCIPAPSVAITNPSPISATILHNGSFELLGEDGLPDGWYRFNGGIPPTRDIIGFDGDYSLGSYEELATTLCQDVWLDPDLSGGYTLQMGAHLRAQSGGSGSLDVKVGGSSNQSSVYSVNEWGQFSTTRATGGGGLTVCAELSAGLLNADAMYIIPVSTVTDQIVCQGYIDPDEVEIPDPPPDPPPIPLPNGGLLSLGCYDCIAPNSLSLYDWGVYFACFFLNIFGCWLQQWLLTIFNVFGSLWSTITRFPAWLAGLFQLWGAWAGGWLNSLLSWLGSAVSVLLLSVSGSISWLLSGLLSSSFVQTIWGYVYYRAEQGALLFTMSIEIFNILLVLANYLADILTVVWRLLGAIINGFNPSQTTVLLPCDGLTSPLTLNALRAQTEMTREHVCVVMVWGVRTIDELAYTTRFIWVLWTITSIVVYRMVIVWSLNKLRDPISA